MVEATYTLRDARRVDAPRIHELHTASVRALCAGHYPQDIIDGWLQNRSPQGYIPGIDIGHTFVVEDGGAILGFGEAAPGSVIAVFVQPSAACRGIGTALTEHALQLAQRGHSGPVRVESTLNAVAFYRRFGFREKERTTVTRDQVQVPIVVMERDDD
jgi:ribosomal protein S18 acetylase RimI-like enzyme